ncbi:endonuclease/exonuclease/phosphatase family protein [Paludicola sp. MB14-C6]|uniref:endonuclease/exonuclease/phosphatase family protein n=1 Tax=Paludihabitans sp. MB14-C6 TaxID=3070656 RepID=UPI0027DB972A|nr:endonuclease/exonuclease/phosphatase family protein [Paludicola sp. MB14-C6]WMJ22729.1 endonuclease/exonuclease/phosphatase family protein [Paludicola sp. MB14-C6]
MKKRLNLFHSIINKSKNLNINTDLSLEQTISYFNAQNAEALKVMSFNMKRNYFSFGQNSWKNRVELIANLIDLQQPDVVGTQELTAKNLNDLTKLLPNYDVVGQGRGGDDKGEYTAIFYRKDKFKLKDQETFWLSATPNKPSRAWFALCPRICTTCTLELQGNTKRFIRIFNTHLDHLSFLSRKNSLQLISSKMQEKNLQQEASVLLMGDFNAKPKSKTIKAWYQDLSTKTNNALQNAYLQCDYSDIGRSFHGFKGKIKGMPIDYIFASSSLDLQRVSLCRDSINNRYPSDHYPVLAQYMLSC